MKFCTKCESIIIKKKEGEYCSKCDRDKLEKITENSKKQKIYAPEYSMDKDFPFIKNNYYKRSDVTNLLRCGRRTGINFIEDKNCLVLFMKAYDLHPTPNNPYRDKFDNETGLYTYIGKGLEGDQKFSGANEYLAKSNETNTDIHFFRQFHVTSNYLYTGKVKLVEWTTDTQPDKHGDDRTVFKFILRPIE